MVCDMIGVLIQNVGAERVFGGVVERRREKRGRNLLAQAEEDVGIWCCCAHGENCENLGEDKHEVSLPDVI